jgi:hypothetical protein
VIEIDWMEYFHFELPGQLTSTLHRADNTGTLRSNVNKTNYFFEAPTYTPGWHTITGIVLPWTANTIGGGVAGNPANPSANVRLTCQLDGVTKWDYLDTQALYWTTNGGPDGDNFYNIYHQGSQVGGHWAGHPDDPFGYFRAYDGSRSSASDAFGDGCISGGTKPNACTFVRGGYSVQRAGRAGSLATFNLDSINEATDYETDYIRVYKYTG